MIEIKNAILLKDLLYKGKLYHSGDILYKYNDDKYYCFARGNEKIDIPDVENHPQWFDVYPKYVRIPEDATNLEVFHIRGNEAFIGWKNRNGDLHYLKVPYNPLI